MPLLNCEGKNIPNVTFIIYSDGQIVKKTTEELFKDRTIVVFSLPGAFTPTCSTSHLPGYNDLAPALHKNGVNEIICLSVNDTFVMNAWCAVQQVKNVTLIGDGNGDFTRGMGMMVDKKDLGFGERSWRYSMLVKNMKVEKMFIEPKKKGDPFEVSNAETMLKYINPKAVLPHFTTLIGKKGCNFCEKAKKLLQKHHYSFEEIDLGDKVTTKTLRALAGVDRDTTPQIFIDGKHIGGADDLEKYFASSK